MKSNFAYKKLQNIAKLVIIDINFIAIRPMAILILAFNKDDYISKIPNKFKLLAFQFANFLKREIAKIFPNKFQPMNLYKLYHIRRYDNIYWNKIFIKKKLLKYKKLLADIKIIIKTTCFS